MMLSCREVSRLVASEELAATGWLRRLGARMHFLMCRNCREYASQIRAMGRMARRGWSGPGPEEPPGEEDRARARLEKELLERLRSQPPRKT